MPDYTAQLNQIRAKSIKMRIAEKATAKISKTVVQRMMKAIEDKQTWAWPFAIGIALFNDFLDLLVIGSIPIIGSLIDILTGLILFMFLFNIGGHIRLKVRIIIFLANFLELIPFVGFIPIWGISILWAWYRVHQKGEIAEEGLRKLKEGTVDKRAVSEFS
jgi:hypothetical protein